MKHILLATILAASATLARADTIDLSGSITGTFAVDPGGRCSPFATITASGTGIADLLGSFIDAESSCMTTDSSLDDGLFTFTSVSNPGDSLFGTFFGVAFLQDSVLDFSSIFLVGGGTGQFANDVGAIFGFGTLDEQTGALSETISGELDGPTPTPEPGSVVLLATVSGAAWVLTRARRRASLSS